MNATKCVPSSFYIWNMLISQSMSDSNLLHIVRALPRYQLDHAYYAALRSTSIQSSLRPLLIFAIIVLDAVVLRYYMPELFSGVCNLKLYPSSAYMMHEVPKVAALLLVIWKPITYLF